MSNYERFPDCITVRYIEIRGTQEYEREMKQALSAIECD